MFKPTFFTDPSDALFIPAVSHPGEDAGADIRAYVRDSYDRDSAIKFYRDYEHQSVKYGTRMYIDGEVFTSESESEFVTIIEQCGGAAMVGPGETIKVDTGFKVILPSLKDKGYPWNMLLPVYKIVPRSGLAYNHGIVVTNSPGIVDPGYRDWVKVSLTNHIGVGMAGDNYHVFTHGARIAQGLCEMVIDQSNPDHITDPALVDKTSRGLGGFGSTSLS